MRDSPESRAARQKALAYTRLSCLWRTITELLANKSEIPGIAVDTRYMEKGAALVISRRTAKGKRLIMSVLFHCDGSLTLRRIMGQCRERFSTNVFDHCETKAAEAIHAL